MKLLADGVMTPPKGAARLCVQRQPPVCMVRVEQLMRCWQAACPTPLGGCSSTRPLPSFRYCPADLTRCFAPARSNRDVSAERPAHSNSCAPEGGPRWQDLPEVKGPPAGQQLWANGISAPNCAPRSEGAADRRTAPLVRLLASQARPLEACCRRQTAKWSNSLHGSKLAHLYQMGWKTAPGSLLASNFCNGLRTTPPHSTVSGWRSAPEECHSLLL
jgi:hypothetical protein